MLKHQYIILGAGPAGLQLAYYLHQKNLDYVVLEKGEQAGSFFEEQPRHRTLISINKVYTGLDDPEVNLRWDWNSLLSNDYDHQFRDYNKNYYPDADDMVRYLRDYASKYNLNVQYGVNVKRISKEKVFCVQDSESKQYNSDVLIVATGIPKIYKPKILGIELAETYNTMSVDPEDFANQRVLIIGKGNSGFETANHLLAVTALTHIVSPNPVTMAWKTKYVGHLRAINNHFIDSYQLKSQNVVLDAKVNNIEKVGDEFHVKFGYSHADGEIETIVYDRVIACTGFCFDKSIFDESCLPETVVNGRFPKQNSKWESTNVLGMYFAGALMQARDYREKQSGFIHGFRYNVRCLAQHLKSTFNNNPWPTFEVELNSDKLARLVLGRVNTSSALWQQTGVMCDLLYISPDQKAVYYQDVSTSYAHDILACGAASYYIITLEFGLEIIAASPDPLAVERIHKNDIERADESSGIHPILRKCVNGNCISEHHVIEDIFSEFKESVHLTPLISYFDNSLSE